MKTCTAMIFGAPGLAIVALTLMAPAQAQNAVTANTLAANPTFSPKGGTYSTSQTVSISDATAHSIIYYTTDGSPPTTASTPYTGPIAVDTTETILAVALAKGYSHSDIVGTTYTISSGVPVPTPVLSALTGTYLDAISVYITDTVKNAAIYYTTDGTTPNGSSTRYTGPVTVNATETLEAIAVATGDTHSALAKANYVIGVSYEDMYNFGASGSADGASTYAGLTQGSDGNFYGATTNGGTYGKGTVFKLTPAGEEQVLYSFGTNGSADASNPYASLVQAADGNFYGTTLYGGASGYGTVYVITPAGVESVLHSFSSGVDGSYPYAALLQGTDDNLYGVTGGGTDPYSSSGSGGAFFQITPAGVLTVLHSFGTANSGDASFPHAAVIQAADGNFYGTSIYGGAYGGGTVFKITPTGEETLLYSFGTNGGSSDGTNPFGSVIQAADGNFYGTTTYGGHAGTGTVFTVTTAGIETLLHSFLSGDIDGGFPYAGLVQGSDGNFYGINSSGGAYATSTFGVGGTFFKITPAGVEGPIYSFDLTGTPSGGYPYAAMFAGTDGNFYGTTTYGGTDGHGVVYSISVAGVEAEGRSAKHD
jgi:uncharacterized repeat protein (TIGR03803 family)